MVLLIQILILCTLAVVLLCALKLKITETIVSLLLCVGLVFFVMPQAKENDKIGEEIKYSIEHRIEFYSQLKQKSNFIQDSYVKSTIDNALKEINLQYQNKTVVIRVADDFRSFERKKQHDEVVRLLKDSGFISVTDTSISKYCAYRTPCETYPAIRIY